MYYNSILQSSKVKFKYSKFNEINALAAGMRGDLSENLLSRNFFLRKCKLNKMENHVLVFKHALLTKVS